MTQVLTTQYVVASVLDTSLLCVTRVHALKSSRLITVTLLCVIRTTLDSSLTITDTAASHEVRLTLATL